MSRHLYLFDLDGTLIEAYMDRPEGERDYAAVVPLPGRIHTISRLRMQGHTCCIVTNQGGVAYGFVTEDEADDKLTRVQRLFRLHDPRQSGDGFPRVIFACYSHPNGRAPWNDPIDAARRKPSPSMIIEAARLHGFHSPESVTFIGDRPEDEQAAQAAGVAYIGPDGFAEFFGEKTP